MIPPNLFHGWKNIGVDEAYIINMPSSAVRARRAGRARLALRVADGRGDRPVPLVEPRARLRRATGDGDRLRSVQLGDGTALSRSEVCSIRPSPILSCSSSATAARTSPSEVVDTSAIRVFGGSTCPRRLGHQVGTEQRRTPTSSAATIVAHIGHDDLWLPRHLELLVAAIDHGSTFAHGRVLHVVPDERPRVIPSRGWSLDIATTAGRAIGGWRLPVDTGSLDPESDLCPLLPFVPGTTEPWGRTSTPSLQYSPIASATRRHGDATAF